MLNFPYELQPKLRGLRRQERKQNEIKQIHTKGEEEKHICVSQYTYLRVATIEQCSFLPKFPDFPDFIGDVVLIFLILSFSS